MFIANRRYLLKMGIASGMAAIAWPVSAQAPRTGGTLVLVAPYGSSLSSLDIHTTVRAQDEIVATALHRSLYIWDSAKGKPIPELASSVIASADGRTYTFHLLKNAFFHNGRQMTADDVIWSYTRIMDPARGFPGARFVRQIEGAVDVEKGTAKAISGLKKIDNFTLELTLVDRADPAYLLFQGVTAILAREAFSDGDGAGTKSTGLGPFKLAEYVPGSRVVGERFEKFYRPGRPYADKVVYQIMGEAAARDLAFRAGEIDATILGSTQYAVYRADPALSKNMLEVAEAYTRHMGFNPKVKAFQDKRVRQAINHAIDRDLIIKKLLRDKAYRATGWLPSTSPAFDAGASGYAYDPKKAASLLKEAGYGDGFSIEVTTNNNEGYGQPVLEAVIPFLARVGITVKPKVVENAVFQELVFASSQYEAYLYSVGSGPDPLAALKTFHSSTPHSAGNYTNYNNPEFDKLIDAATAAEGEAARIEALKKANAFLMEDAPVWFFNYNKAVLAYQPWLHGLQANATELALQRYEDLWVDASSPAAK